MITCRHLIGSFDAWQIFFGDDIIVIIAIVRTYMSTMFGLSVVSAAR